MGIPTVFRFLLSKPTTGTTVTKCLFPSIIISSSSSSSSLICRTPIRALSNSSSLPPKEIIISPQEDGGRDLKHWLVLLSLPIMELSCLRPCIISSYITNLCFVGLCMEESKRRIYSVSTKYYYAYGALMTEDQANKLKNMGKQTLVTNIIPDPYVYEGKKEYQGEPFINGEAVPYDPKYHEAWVRINGEEEQEDYIDQDTIRKEEEERENDRLYGIDYEHWVVLMDRPETHLSRNEIINNYINTLAPVVGSEEEARKRIYAVSTRVKYSFGAFLEEWHIDELKGLPEVIDIYPDSYDDADIKEYDGEPFINGEAVPYDPKYHAKYPIEFNWCPEFDWYLNNTRYETYEQKFLNKINHKPIMLNAGKLVEHPSLVEFV